MPRRRSETRHSSAVAMRGWFLCVAAAASLALPPSHAGSIPADEHTAAPLAIPNGCDSSENAFICSLLGRNIQIGNGAENDLSSTFDSDFHRDNSSGETLPGAFGGADRGRWETLPPRTTVCEPTTSDPVCSILRDMVNNPHKTESRNWARGNGTLFSFRVPSIRSDTASRQPSLLFGGTESFRNGRLLRPKAKYHCKPLNFDPLCFLLWIMKKDGKVTNSSDWLYLVPADNGDWHVIPIESVKTNSYSVFGIDVYWVTKPEKTKICEPNDVDSVCSYLRDNLDQPEFLASASVDKWHDIPNSVWEAGYEGRLPRINYITLSAQDNRYICHPPCCDPVCDLLSGIEENRRKLGTSNWEYLVSDRDGYWSSFTVRSELISNSDQITTWQQPFSPEDTSWVIKGGAVLVLFIVAIIIGILRSVARTFCKSLQAPRTASSDDTMKLVTTEPDEQRQQAGMSDLSLPLSDKMALVHSIDERVEQRQNEACDNGARQEQAAKWTSVWNQP